LSGQQAVAFVRQRRDNVAGDFFYNNFTDLDRERRQQAFISSLAFQLKQAGTFTDPGKVSSIIQVAKQNTAIDSGLILADLAQEATNLTGGQITFHTLPIAGFAKEPGAGDVNLVDLPTIRAEVQQFLNPTPPATPTNAPPSGSPPPPSSSSAPPPPAQVPPGVIDVENSTSTAGAAGKLEQYLVAKGFTQGNAGSHRPEVTHTLVEYGSTGSQAAANAIATMLGNGIAATRSSAVLPGRVRVLIGADYTAPSDSSPTGTSPGTGPVAPTTSVKLPPPNDMTAPPPLAGGGIPCVK
jgi:hypothetical protein